MTTKQIEALVQRANDTMRHQYGDNIPTILVTQNHDGYYSVQLAYKKGNQDITENYAENYFEHELEELITEDIPTYWAWIKPHAVYVLINEWDHSGSGRDHYIVGIYTTIEEAQRKMKHCVEIDIKDYYDNDRSHLVEQDNSLRATLQRGEYEEWDEYKIHIKQLQS